MSAAPLIGGATPLLQLSLNLIGPWVRRFAGAPRDSGAVPRWFSCARALHELPIWIRYALATCFVAVTFLPRYALVGDEIGYHFIFFMPAVVLSSLFLAGGTGIWALVLGSALIGAYLVPHDLALGFVQRESFWALAVFFATGLVTALTGEALHDALFRLAGANEKLTASEQEKDMLLHEVTHRFKNDLANLAAVMQLQARGASDATARTELMTASERVHSLGRVHQRLSRFSETAEVDAGQFLSDLCADIRAASIGARPIELRENLHAVRLPFRQAITLGLIANELVTNALKYAFPHGRSGAVFVELTRSTEGLTLRVADDGVGEASPAADSTGLGQRLIQSMARQIRGTCEVTVRKDGRTCKVHLPDACGPARA